jgi:hypothetical protein
MLGILISVNYLEKRRKFLELDDMRMRVRFGLNWGSEIGIENEMSFGNCLKDGCVCLSR